MLLHVDGSRLANAAAALDVGLGELTAGIGADVVSFGGTKVGLLAAEIVVILNPSLSNALLMASLSFSACSSISVADPQHGCRSHAETRPPSFSPTMTAM